MSDRNFDKAYVIGKRLIDISGTFVPLTGAGTVAASTVRGLGFGYLPVSGTWTKRTAERSGITGSTSGITRTATGTYTVTFEEAFRDIYYQSADLASPNTSGSALWAQPVATATNLNTAATAPTITILIVNSSGSPTDAASGQKVYFHVQFDDSTVGFNKP